MKHFSEMQWMDYVSGSLPETLRETMENHLYECVECLKRFMEAAEQCTQVLPEPAQNWDPAGKALDKALAHIPKKRSRFWDSVLVQYAVAASITLVLFASGVFHDILDGSSNLAQWASGEAGPSITDTLMEKTVSIIDELSK